MSLIIPNWEEHALGLAVMASLRSKDPWQQVGACLLRHDNTPIVGYNGFPAGVKEDWSDREARLLYTVHAEQNALRYVQPNECYLGATTLLPCNNCLKALASYGIRKIVYLKEYERDGTSHAVAEKLGIELKKLDIPIIKSRIIEWLKNNS